MILFYTPLMNVQISIQNKTILENLIKKSIKKYKNCTKNIKTAWKKISNMTRRNSVHLYYTIHNTYIIIRDDKAVQLSFCCSKSWSAA